MKTRAQELGEAIAADRAARGVSQEDIADTIGVTQQAFSGWEAGASLPRSQRLDMLADYFGDGSRTAHVIDHIRPKRGAMGSKGAKGAEHVRFISDDTPTNFDTLGVRFRKSNKPMGDQSGSAPREEHGARQPETAYGIKSFENHSAAHASEILDALTRAQNGVALARQVLDDAAQQLAHALSNMKQ
jgi:DNA-binding XRE family transcriptional regulator